MLEDDLINRDPTLSHSTGAGSGVDLNGDDDALVNYEGGDLAGWPLGNPGVEDRMQQWADHNGCAPEPSEESLSPEVTHITWDGCEATTEWYRIEGGGHTWPGTISLAGLGHTTDEISASDTLWDLFFG